MRVGEKKRNRNSAVSGIIIGGIILSAALIFILFLNQKVKIETDIVLADTSFEVKGMYGSTYNYSDISSIGLKDTLPKITMRTNGAAIGRFKKGYFQLEGLGTCKLFLVSEEGPYLYIKMKDQYIIINYPEKERTEALYKDLSARLPG